MPIFRPGGLFAGSKLITGLMLSDNTGAGIGGNIGLGAGFGNDDRADAGHTRSFVMRCRALYWHLDFLSPISSIYHKNVCLTLGDL